MPKVIRSDHSTNGQAPSNGESRLANIPGVADACARHKTEQPVPDASDKLKWIVAHFLGVKRSGDGYMVRCPGHDDSHASLHITEGKDGRIVMHCHAECSTQEVLDLIELRMCDLMPDSKIRESVVNVYDYRDKVNTLLYQTVRCAPKGFKQRRPNGNGGWIYNLEGVQRVLYRLPELLDSKSGDDVFVVEGEKDADRLVDLGLVTTTHIGGAGKWLPVYTESLTGKSVVISPDNDDVGKKHARQVAQSVHGVAASVRIIELPGLPPKGDVSDWLDAGGTKEQLLALVKQTEPYVHVQKNTCTDVHNSLTSCVVAPLQPVQVLPFPIDALVNRLQVYVRSLADALPCPPDFPGAMLLPVLSAFIGRKRCVQIKPGWTEYPTLWVVVVAPSGEKKSPAFDNVTAPLRDKEKQLHAEYCDLLRAYNALPKEKKEKEPRPLLKQIMTTDTTIEALKDVLAGNPNGIILAADELSGWARAMSQYKGSRGDDRKQWLSIWSGITARVNRKGSGPLFIPDPFVSVTGGVQPAALSDLIQYRNADDDGFGARLLPSFPDLVPARPWNEDTIQESSAYATLCNDLWELPPSKEPITFSPAAKAIWVEWYNRHQQANPPDYLRPTWAKCEGHCARLALVLFLSRKVCGETQSEQIDEESITGAVKLIDYFMSHARRAYTCTDVHYKKDRVTNALEWLRKQADLGKPLTAKAVQMARLGGIRNAEEAKELLHYLAEEGHGTVTEEARGSYVFRFKDTPGQPVNESTGC